MSSASRSLRILDPRRWTRALIALVVIYLSVFAYKLLQNYALLPTQGPTDGYDFMAFWSAAVLALDGQGSLAYLEAPIRVIQRDIFPLDVGFYPWLYPPSLLLLLVPLGMLPYLLAYLVWTLTTLALLCAVLWRFVPHPTALLVLLAAPLSERIFATGQTSFLTTALLGLFALDLERRPGRAGLWLGLVSLKPQLGVLAALALVASGYWRTVVVAALTILALGAASLAVFAPMIWRNFFQTLLSRSQTLPNSEHILAVVVTPFSALRLAGAEMTASYGAHLVLAAATGLLVAWIWWRPFASDLKLACLIAGSALMSPFILDYDLMVLAVPFAIIVRRALRDGWLKGEPEALFFVWLFPAVATVLAVNTAVQLGFVTPLVMLALCLRRTLRCADAAPLGP